MNPSPRSEAPALKSSWPAGAVSIALTAVLLALTLCFLFLRVFPQTATLSAVEKDGQWCAFVDDATYDLLRVGMPADSAGLEGGIVELGPWMDAQAIAAYVGNPLAPAALDVPDGRRLVLLALPPAADDAAVRQARIDLGRAGQPVVVGRRKRYAERLILQGTLCHADGYHRVRRGQPVHDPGPL